MHTNVEVAGPVAIVPAKESPPASGNPAGTGAEPVWRAVQQAETAILDRAVALAAAATPPSWHRYLPVAVRYLFRGLEAAIDLGRPDLADQDLRWLAESLPETLGAPVDALVGAVAGQAAAVVAAVEEHAPAAAGAVRAAAGEYLARLRRVVAERQTAEAPSAPGVDVPPPVPLPVPLPWSAAAQAVIDALDATVYIVDRGMRLVAVNAGWDHFARQNGYPAVSAPSIVGRNMLDGLKGSGRAHWAVVCRRLLGGELPRHQEDISCHAPHQARVFSITVQPLFAPRAGTAEPAGAGDGGVAILPAGLLFVSADVTAAVREVAHARQVSRRPAGLAAASDAARLLQQDVERSLARIDGAAQLLGSHADAPPAARPLIAQIAGEVAHVQGRLRRFTESFSATALETAPRERRPAADGRSAGPPPASAAPAPRRQLDPAALMTSGEFVRHLGTTRRVVDHAEEAGLLQPAARTPQGHRLYGPDQARRLALVMHLYELGVSAARIKEWLAAPPEQLPQRLAAHRAWLRQQAERALAQAGECAAEEEVLSAMLAEEAARSVGRHTIAHDLNSHPASSAQLM